MASSGSRGIVAWSVGQDEVILAVVTAGTYSVPVCSVWTSREWEEVSVDVVSIGRD